MSDRATGILQVPPAWRPDELLNPAAQEGGSFSERQFLSSAGFVEASFPTYHPGKDSSLAQSPEEASAPSLVDESCLPRRADEKSENFSGSGFAEDQPDSAVTLDLLPVPSAPDEQRLRQEYDRGFAAGLESGRVDAHKSVDLAKRGLRELFASLNDSLRHPQEFFLPMERLAIHIAEQLVRGELSLSGEAIRRLVENVLCEVDHHGDRVTVRLHPEDLESFSLLDGDLSNVVQIVRDSSLSRGSVKLEMSGGTIDDLIEDRLEAIARSLLGSNADGYLNRSAGSLRSNKQDDMARFQRIPQADKFSTLVSAQESHIQHDDPLNANQYEAGPAT